MYRILIALAVCAGLALPSGFQSSDLLKLRAVGTVQFSPDGARIAYSIIRNDLPRRPFGPNPGSFGHFGTGGAVGFADPVGGVAFGYVMNHVIPRWQSTRNRALIDAVYGSL